MGPTYHEARASGGDGSIEVGLSSSLRLGFEGPRVAARTTMHEGDAAYVALHWSEHGGPEDMDDAFVRMNRTSGYWREWLGQGEFPDHPWRSYLERSALTLKGLSFAPTGAIVSAPTTSLPRVPHGDRNYDYRYTFKRDAGFTLFSGYTLAFDWEADDFFYYLADVAQDGGATQNMFSVDGRDDISERTLDNLTGYEHAQPVRVGNDAYRYEQHDVYGAIVDAADLHARARGGLLGARLADDPPPGRARRGLLERAGPGYLGLARRAAPLHLVEGDVLGRARPRRAARGPAAGPRPAGPMAHRRRRGPAETCSRTRSTSATSSRPTTRRPISTRRCC